MAQSTLKKRAPKANAKKAKQVYRAKEGKVIAPKRKDRQTQAKLSKKLGANAIAMTEKVMATRAAADGKLSLLGGLADKKEVAKAKKAAMKKKK